MHAADLNGDGRVDLLDTTSVRLNQGSGVFGAPTPHGAGGGTFTAFARTPSEGATVYGEIARSRTVTRAQRERYGGPGPMSPDPAFIDELCPHP